MCTRHKADSQGSPSLKLEDCTEATGSKVSAEPDQTRMARGIPAPASLSRQLKARGLEEKGPVGPAPPQKIK